MPSTRRLRLDYGEHGLEAEIPAAARILDMADVPALDDVDARLEEAFRQPIGAPALARLARGRRSACVVISDITRPVPNPVILPPLLRTLEEAGIERRDITILVGTGLHRPNEGEELVRLVGARVAADYRIENHRARDRESLVHLGRTSGGAPIWIDRLYVEADLKIATSLIEPHLMAGYSGGRKAVCPGIVGVDTIRVLHGPELMSHPRSAEGVIDGNPFHRQALEVALRVGVDFTLNVAMNHRREVTGIFAGDLEEAHAAGVAFVEAGASAWVEEPAPIVVTTSAGYPLDLTFYQAVKGLTAVRPVVADGGTIVLAARCAEGLGSPEFVQLLEETESVEAFEERLKDPGFFRIDQWQLQELCKVLRRARVLLYSEGVDAGGPHLRGLVEPVPSVEAGIQAARIGHGEEAPVAVVPRGPYVLARSRRPRPAVKGRAPLAAALAMSGLLLGACATMPGLESVVMMEEEEAEEPAAEPAAEAPLPPPLIPHDGTDFLGQKILLLPFLDSSKYKGAWDIHRGLARTLGDSLAHNSFYHIVPVDSALAYLEPPELTGEIGHARAAGIGAFLGADWVILGNIEELTMKRFQATVPLGGYRSYEGIVMADLTLVNAIDGRRGGELSTEGVMDSKRTGITNPAAFVPLDKQYFFLDDLAWNSDTFRESLVGKALAAWAKNAAAAIAEQIRPPPSLEVAGRIMVVDGAVAYINLGLADGIRNGDKFAVWDQGQELTDPETGEVLGKTLPSRVGTIQVEQILSEHLSKSRVLEGVDSIRLNDALRAE